MINHCVIDGIFVADPRLDKTSTGKPVCNFLIDSLSKDRQHNSIIRCTAWENKALLIARRYRKGDPLSIHGAMQVDEVVKDGIKSQKHTLVVRDFYESSGEWEEASEQTFVTVAEVKKRLEQLHENTLVCYCLPVGRGYGTEVRLEDAVA